MRKYSRLINALKSIKYRWMTRHQVILFYWHRQSFPNLGDELSPIIVEWMLNQRGLSLTTRTKKRREFSAVGSIIGKLHQHTIWGSGFLSANQAIYAARLRKVFHSDIRAIRGPLTRQALLAFIEDVPEIYGDPAILMPLIYPGKKLEKKYQVSLITHHQHPIENTELHQISILTRDYSFFIDEILRSELVISSSLHGIILAEAYGVPAIWLNNGPKEQVFKFIDWYYSTNRYAIKAIDSLEQINPQLAMPIPDLEGMRQDLINCFPYDLWQKT